MNGWLSKIVICDDFDLISIVRRTEEWFMVQQGIREGGLENNSTDLEMLLGRKPASVKEALQQLLA